MIPQPCIRARSAGRGWPRHGVDGFHVEFPVMKTRLFALVCLLTLGALRRRRPVRCRLASLSLDLPRRQDHRLHLQGRPLPRAVGRRRGRPADDAHGPRLHARVEPRRQADRLRERPLRQLRRLRHARRGRRGQASDVPLGRRVSLHVHRRRQGGGLRRRPDGHRGEPPLPDRVAARALPGAGRRRPPDPVADDARRGREVQPQRASSCSTTTRRAARTCGASTTRRPSRATSGSTTRRPARTARSRPSPARIATRSSPTATRRSTTSARRAAASTCTRWAWRAASRSRSRRSRSCPCGSSACPTAASCASATTASSTR